MAESGVTEQQTLVSGIQDRREVSKISVSKDLSFCGISDTCRKAGSIPPPVLLPGIWLVQFRQIKHKMQVSQLTIEHWWVLVKKKILELSRNLPAPRESKEGRVD